MAFFPSYRFMEEVYDRFRTLLEEKGSAAQCVIQAPYMSEEAREIFLEEFEEDRDESLLGFCVMGGIFSEGIDLSRDRLIGAAVVGDGPAAGVPGEGTFERLFRQERTAGV